MISVRRFASGFAVGLALFAGGSAHADVPAPGVAKPRRHHEPFIGRFSTDYELGAWSARHLYWSHDDGSTWTRMGDLPPGVKRVASFGGHYSENWTHERPHPYELQLVADTSGGLFVSVDEGATWAKSIAPAWDRYRIDAANQNAGERTLACITLAPEGRVELTFDYLAGCGEPLTTTALSWQDDHATLTGTTFDGIGTHEVTRHMTAADARLLAGGVFSATNREQMLGACYSPRMLAVEVTSTCFEVTQTEQFTAADCGADSFYTRARGLKRIAKLALAQP